MSDHRRTVGDWLSCSFIWRIPVYQRHYAWDAKEEPNPIDLFWQTIEEQTIARLKGETPPQHYLGAVLVDNKTDPETTDDIKHFDVVDGQQRLTTIQIALLALIWEAGKHDCGDAIKEKLEKYVFSNKTKTHPRLVPTNFDNKQFQSILFDAYDIILDFGAQKVSKENANKSKIVENYEYFKNAYEGFVESESAKHEKEKIIEAITDTLTKGFDLILITLRGADEAQRIFESLNSFSKPLTTFDLIRNNVFHRAALIERGKDKKDQNERGKDEQLFYTSAWQQLENSYWEQKSDKSKGEGSKHIEAYVARTLVAKMKKEILFNRNSIFTTYKAFSERYSSIEEEINSLVDYADIYRRLDNSTEQNKAEFGVFHYDIWKDRSFYPVIFSIVGSNTSDEEKQRMLNLLESYVVRRSICGLSVKNYNKHAVSICKELSDEPKYAELHQVLMNAKTDTTLFPDDQRVLEGCVTTKFYGSVFQRYVFEQIESSMHEGKAERVIVKEGVLTIDHILPQKWEENKVWKNIVLGAEGNQNDALTVGVYIHTIGNLTIMSGKNNAIKSNRPFDDVKALLNESTVKLNRELVSEEIWNVKKIVERSKKLGTKICEIWPYDIV